MAMTGPVWKYRPGPSEEKVIGNERMISLWPVRTSVLVDQGTVYCGAGVFPYEGIYICALNADDGSVIWKNDTIGDRRMNLLQYIAARLPVPRTPLRSRCRVTPAAFSRARSSFWALLEQGAAGP
jgi:hypothetical protein